MISNILDFDYIENTEKWKTQKKRLYEKYKKKYQDKKIKLMRVKTDTPGLKQYAVVEER
jgi:hypothetical protein